MTEWGELTLDSTVERTRACAQFVWWHVWVHTFIHVFAGGALGKLWASLVATVHLVASLLMYDVKMCYVFCNRNRPINKLIFHSSINKWGGPFALSATLSVVSFVSVAGAGSRIQRT